MDLWLMQAFLHINQPFLWEFDPGKGAFYMFFSHCASLHDMYRKMSGHIFIFVLCVYIGILWSVEVKLTSHVADKSLWVVDIWQMNSRALCLCKLNVNLCTYYEA